MFINVATESAQHAHVRMMIIILEKVQTQIICFLDVINTIIVKQSVNHKKNILNDSQTAEELH